MKIRLDLSKRENRNRHLFICWKQKSRPLCQHAGLTAIITNDYAINFHAEFSYIYMNYIQEIDPLLKAILHRQCLEISPYQQHAGGNEASARDDEHIQQVSYAYRTQNCNENISSCTS